MSKIRIPKLLEKHSVLPLQFDQRSSKFIVGTSEDYVSPHTLLGELPYKKDTLALDDLAGLSLGVVDGSAFITGPKVNKLLLSQQRMVQRMAHYAVSGAEEVMNDMYVELQTTDTIDEKKFRAHHDTRQGVVKLSTTTSDAVFVTGRSGRIVRAVEMKPTHFAEYEALSADGYELIAFLAGMGHIARKAAEY
jgi:hypothetical protein